MKYLAIIQARLNSSRLPSKVMLDLGGEILLRRSFDSVSTSMLIDDVVVATSTEDADKIIVSKAKQLKIKTFEGSLKNVLDRFYKAASQYGTQNIVRITADNPLMDGGVIDLLINDYEKTDCEYACFKNAVYGLSAEIFSFESLKKAYFSAQDNFEKEHVTPFIKSNSKVFYPDSPGEFRYPDIRATIDTFEDYVAMQRFYLECIHNCVKPTIRQYIQYSLGRKC